MEVTGDANPSDAVNMAPMQDWHLASLLAAMFNTNDFRPLVSVNSPDPNAWAVLLDGMTALTNTAPGSFDTLIISSNSPQTSLIANAIQSGRAGSQMDFSPTPGTFCPFPQLSTASPFSEHALSQCSISDAAYEEIPSQLLLLIRSDSIGSAGVAADGRKFLQFTGYDGHDYAIQTSTNLLDWQDIGTNSPVGGILHLPVTIPSDSPAQFYRSILLN